MLDVSGSMSGEPMEAMKDAAVGVCEKFLKADPKTVISVVAFGTNVQSLRYSSDFTSLAAYIRSLKAYGMTNMSGGMEEVKLILNGSNGKQKSVIIMADGMPNEGGHSYDADYGYDGYQNYALNYDNNNLKTAATVYSIGFFDSYQQDGRAVHSGSGKRSEVRLHCRGCQGSGRCIQYDFPEHRHFLWKD